MELARGFISDNEQPLEEFAQEFGLKGGYKLIEASSYNEDHRTKAVNVTTYLINVDKTSRSLSFPMGEDTDEYGEEILTEELSGKDVIKAIQNGTIRDEYSIYGLCLYMLRSTGELFIDKAVVGDMNVYLKKQFILQEGEFKWQIPEGQKGLGTLIGETLSDSSVERLVDEVNEVALNEAKGQNIEGLESVPVAEAIENIENGVYDAPTAATLILGFLKKGYLKYKTV